jgi:hypothetical protein
MKTLFIVIFCIYLIVSSISMMIGLDLKKWYSWLVGVYGFLTGFLMSLVYSDTQTAIPLGLFFAFFTLTSAAVTYQNRKNSLKFFESLDHEKYPRLTRYVNFLKKLFHL